jgi:hypothetical protein
MNRIPQFPGHRRKRLELFADWVAREKEQEHKIDRSCIDCLEINWSVQARENTEWLIQFLNAGVGNRHTAACPG